jgi:hypothetical protein
VLEDLHRGGEDPQLDDLHGFTPSFFLAGSTDIRKTLDISPAFGDSAA